MKKTWIHAPAGSRPMKNDDTDAQTRPDAPIGEEQPETTTTQPAANDEANTV